MAERCCECGEPLPECLSMVKCFKCAGQAAVEMGRAMLTRGEEAKLRLTEDGGWSPDPESIEFNVEVFQVEPIARTEVTVWSSPNDEVEITYLHYAAAAAALLDEAAKRSPDGYERALDVIQQMAMSNRAVRDE